MGEMRHWINLCEAAEEDGFLKNEDGDLLPVFHGTPNQFTTFERRPSSVPMAEIGFWFAGSRDVAQMIGWRKGNHPRIIAANLKMRHPFILNDSGVDGLTQLTRVVSPTGEVTREDVNRFRDELIAKGYDGIILRGVRADGGLTDNYIVFEPDQIQTINSPDDGKQSHGRH
jgi:hypothetical protein